MALNEKQEDEFEKHLKETIHLLCQLYMYMSSNKKVRYVRIDLGFQVSYDFPCKKILLEQQMVVSVIAASIWQTYLNHVTLCLIIVL